MTVPTDRPGRLLRTHRVGIALALISLPLAPLRVAAQCDPEADPECATGTAEGEAGSRAFPAFTRGTLGFRLQVGVSGSDVPPVLPGLDDGLPFVFGATIAPWPSGLVEFDLAWIGWSRSFPTEDATSLGPLLTVNDRVDLGTNAVTAGLRLSLPLTTLVRPYTTAGLGWVHHKAQLDGSVFFIPGTVAESTSTDWTFCWGGGIDTRFGAWGVSLDYRRMETAASFGDPFDIPNIDLGGSSIYVGASWWPGD